MIFGVGDAVIWKSSSTRKEGVVVAIVPAGLMPAYVGYPTVGKGALPRNHDSYVVRGHKLAGRPVSSLYWPVVSLLYAADCLTPAEVAWCHKNSALVRAFINDASMA